MFSTRYVGYVEKVSGVWYFALQMGDTNYERLLSQRITKARDQPRRLALSWYISGSTRRGSR
jgi:hypothetical protein